MSKKIKRTIAKFDFGGQLLGQMGLPDPLSEALGTSPGQFAKEDAEKLAKEAEMAGSTAAPAAPPTAVSDETLSAREAQRRRQLAAAGMGGTQLTGSSGLGSATTSMKSLLGS